uniref:Uncharacterized protein n=1 Tax=Timema monikensis TaxID=170555 RepID=A0A7R9EFE0_9NEOP|nr:unnamed protein product [Timema monikensis]
MVYYGLITVVLMALVQLVLTYHFQDPYFNNGLLLEMEEMKGLPKVYSHYKRSLTNQLAISSPTPSLFLFQTMASC